MVTRTMYVNADGTQLMCLMVKGWTVYKCDHAICRPHMRHFYKGKPANGVR